jgi:hypothetical protein
VNEVKCGHCGREMPPHQRAYANGIDLCHTGTMPPDAYPPDCYRLVLIYRHAANGSCCPELAAASGLAQRMADKAGHAALLRAAAEILEVRNLPGDACLQTTLLCAADAFPWKYGVMPPDVDDVMTGLVRTADEIVQQGDDAEKVDFQFSRDEMRDLRRIANEQNMTVDEMIRTWLLERLQPKLPSMNTPGTATINMMSAPTGPPSGGVNPAALAAAYYTQGLRQGRYGAGG